MKTINIKNTMAAQNNTSIQKVDIEDRQPCWYANLDLGSDRTDATWVVGIKGPDKEKDEYSFKLSNAGDVTSDDFWVWGTSSDFAIKLIKLFKDGRPVLTNWIKKGCPQENS